MANQHVSTAAAASVKSFETTWTLSDTGNSNINLFTFDKVYYSLGHFKSVLSVFLNIFTVISREWDKEVYKAEQQGRDPSFLRAIVRSFGLGYSLVGLIALMHVSESFGLNVVTLDHQVQLFHMLKINGCV